MADETVKKGSGIGARLVLWFVILCLLGTVWVLASERNEHRYALGSSNGKLVVSKGRYFPTGTARDPKYPEIAIPAGAKAPPDAEYDDQNALDRALFDVLFPWARDLSAKDPAQAQALVERASQLPGLTPSQLTQLASLRSGLNYTTAMDELQQAQKLVDSARRRLQTVKDAGADRALEAGRALQQLQPVSDELGSVTK